MPSINITTNTLRYSAADVAILAKALVLVNAIAAHDAVIKQDAATAANSLTHICEHVEKQRAK